MKTLLNKPSCPTQCSPVERRRQLGRSAAMLAMLLPALVITACGSSNTASGGDERTGAPDAAPGIKVLSNRSDLVSGGDVLLDVVLPVGTAASGVQVLANGRNVTSQFHVLENGHLRGLVDGLALGTNNIVAEVGNSEMRTQVINHPNGGPIFTGPQIQPWRCPATATDEQCNQPPTYTYYYKSSNPLVSGLQPYDPAAPASDVAMTTTDQGVTVPFIVREEIGYQNRDQYRIVVLYQPEQEWAPWAVQEQWNGKVLMPGGGGCGVGYGASSAPTADYAGTFDVIPPEAPVSVGDSPTVALSRGFAVVSTAMSNTGHNCNVAMNAESLMMAKERVVEQYGPIRYTIGTGCSGGAIVQQTVANAYPGIYQGLIVTCSYPDTASPGAGALDYHLLRKYFEDPTGWGSGVVWNPQQWAAVEGHLLPVNAIVMDELLFKGAVTPTGGCAGADSYHPETNPGGVRCDIFQFMVNIFGPRLPEEWSANEAELGRGFGGIPLGNVGVQYGLEALRSGVITPAMFVDVNEKIGGLDIDINPTAQRLKPSKLAKRNMYRSGWLNSASNLQNVAIIDHGGPDPAIAHDAHWAWSMRARLQREQGHFDNHVIWFGQTPLIGDPNYSSEALVAMDRWLAQVEADDRDVAIEQKIVQNRPGDLSDRCSSVSAVSSPDGVALPLLQPTLEQLLGSTVIPGVNSLHDLVLQQVLDPALRLVVDPVLETVCGAGAVGDLARMEFSTPRGAAGQSGTYDDHECQLKPLNRGDNYGPFGFSDDEWTRLQGAFPDGVCDYSQPGVDKQDTITWMTYSDANGAVVYGGKPMPAAPSSSGQGWASPAFSVFDVDGL